MTSPRRRAALRVGGAVISASMLLLLERCAREPPPGPAPGIQIAPPPAARVAPTAPGPSRDHRPRAPVAPDLGRPRDRSFSHLVAALPQRERPRLVAANDAAPPAADLPAPDPPAGPVAPPQTVTAAAPPGPSLHDLAATVQPREPLLGLAQTGEALPQAAAVAADAASVPESGPVAVASANDNTAPVAPATDGPPIASPSPAVAPAAPIAIAPATPASPPSGEAQQAQSPAPALAVTARSPAPGTDLSRAKEASPAVAPVSPAPAPPPPAPETRPPPAISGSELAAAPASVPDRPSVQSPRTSGIAAQAKPITGFADDDELILEITTARRELNGTIVAYNQRGIAYLPLGEVARFLDLAITVGDGGRYASGWAVDPAKTVTINLREGTFTVDGHTHPLAVDDAVAFDGELYLRADRFADLLPLTLTTNLRAQTILVQTRVPFPFEQRLARETAREQLRGRQSRRDGRSFARAVTPWRALDLPLLDSELRLASDTTRGTRSEADIRLAGDLAWLTARSFFSLDSQKGLTAARLELGRRDPDGTLLGPLGATAFGLGDVASTPLAMGPASVGGRGITLGNVALERASVFDRIELRGDLPDGYEAELYRNNVLIDTAATGQGGQYRFLNIPVEFGLNVFRVVLYGPQGQRRETVRQISVGDGRLGQGEFVYSASAVQKNRALLGRQGRDFTPGSDDGSLRMAAELQYGFTSGLTGTFGGAWYERFGTRHWLATAGLRSGLAGFAVKLDLGLSDRSGRALGLGLARKLGGFSVTLNHAEYGGRFVDEVRAFSDQPLRRASELTINGALRIGGGDAPLQIPINGLARNLVFADGRRVMSASLNQTVPLTRGLQLAHLVELNRTSQPLLGTVTQLRGSFDLATLTRSSTQFRASLGYIVTPGTQISTAVVQVDRRIGEQTTITASAGHMFQASQDRFGLSALRRFDRFSLALDASYATRPRQYATMLRLSFSLGRNPLDGRLFTAQSGLASGGAIALHAFRDLDGDGQPGPGEPPLAGVRFFAGNENRETDAQGKLLLGRLGDGPRTSIRIDPDTLPDLNLAPVVEGIELVPRAGRIHVQQFPVRALGELDGTAFFRSAGGERGVSGVIVLLIDPQGKAAARTRTGSDGSFWFEKVKPGAYQVQLDPGQAERLKIRLADPVAVTIGNDGEGERAALHLVSTELAPAT